jgi:hypothetical protein
MQNNTTSNVWSIHALRFQSELLESPTLMITTGLVAFFICIVTLSSKSKSVSSLAISNIEEAEPQRILTAALREMVISRTAAEKISPSMAKIPLLCGSPTGKSCDIVLVMFAYWGCSQVLSDEGKSLAGDDPYIVRNGSIQELVISSPDQLQEFLRNDAKGLLPIWRY